MSADIIYDRQMETSEGEDSLVLHEEYAKVHLKALKPSTRKKLSLYLNLEGTIVEDVGHENNFRGLAEMAGFEYVEIKNFEQQKNPTEEMLHEWTMRQDLTPTVGQLWGFLSQLERFDVLIESQSFIFKDCQADLSKKAVFAKKAPKPPIQENSVSQSTDRNSSRSDLLTVHDVAGGTPTMYDAFICYKDKKPDLDFVLEMIEFLERQHGMKLFIPGRDDLPGPETYKTTAELIKHRCKRMVVVLSPRFLTSESCDFQTKFAQSLSPGARSKKIVPILYEHCLIPDILRFVTLCDYTKKDLINWFWMRLASSLKAPLDLEDENSASGDQVRREIDVATSLLECHSGSSLGSSMSNNASSSGSACSSSSFSRSPRLGHAPKSHTDNRTPSPNLSSRQLGDYILVDKMAEQYRHSRDSGSKPPQVPPTGNRTPLAKLGSSTPPVRRNADSSPQNRAVNPPTVRGGVAYPPVTRVDLTPQTNRPLPPPPNEKKEDKGEKVYFI